MSSWDVLKGTLEAFFRFGKGNAGIKGIASDTLASRNAADGAYAKHAGADATTDDQFTTRRQLNVVGTGVAAAIKVIAFDLLLATKDSTALLPAGCKVRSVRLEIATAYNNGALWEVGYDTVLAAFMGTGENDPTIAGDAFEKRQWTTSKATAVVVKATVSGGVPILGAGTVVVEYVETPLT